MKHFPINPGQGFWFGFCRRGEAMVGASRVESKGKKLRIDPSQIQREFTIDPALRHVRVHWD
jgi:hypothetical protein